MSWSLLARKMKHCEFVFRQLTSYIKTDCIHGCVWHLYKIGEVMAFKIWSLSLLCGFTSTNYITFRILKKYSVNSTLHALLCPHNHFFLKSCWHVLWIVSKERIYNSISLESIQFLSFSSIQIKLSSDFSKLSPDFLSYTFIYIDR